MIALSISIDSFDDDVLDGVWAAVDPTLTQDVAFQRRAIAANGDVLGENGISPSLRDDRDLVLLAVGSSGTSLAFASDRLRDDPQVVTAAIAANPGAYLSASPRLQQDRGVATQAVERDPWMFNRPLPCPLPAPDDPEFGRLIVGPMYDPAFNGLPLGLTRFSRNQ